MKLVRVIATAALLAITAKGQFRIIGPAPVTPAVARQRIRALIEQADAGNLEETNKQINGLLAWYREVLDEELIAAWKRNDSANLARLLEEWVDGPVAAGVVESSWRELRATKFIPANEKLLSLMMTRYPDSTKSFFDDLTGSAETQPPDLAPPQSETACRILLDLPDIRDFHNRTLQILRRYPQVVDALLTRDLGDPAREYDARRWLADLRRGAAPAAGATVADRSGQEAAELFRSKQYAAALQRATACANAGNATCMYVLGEIYASGNGANQNYGEASRWYRLSAEKGDRTAMAALGRLYESGTGLPQDYVQAFEWYSRGAQKGSTAAMVNLGLMYESGHALDRVAQPVRLDYGEALKWFTKAAELGDAAAMYRLASCYEIGKGTTPDRAVAMEWRRKATAAGSEAPTARAADSISATNPASSAALNGVDSIIEDARRAAGQSLKWLPDFTAKRAVNTFLSRGDQTQWRYSGAFRSDLVFQNGKENYLNSVITGKPFGEGMQLPVWTLASIAQTLSGAMNPKIRFLNQRSAVIQGRATLRYDCAVEQLQSQWFVSERRDSYRAAYTGSIWIDQESHDVLRLEMTARDLPEDFLFHSSKAQIDYDYVSIGGRKVALPARAETIACARASGSCVRLEANFQDYVVAGGERVAASRPSGNVTMPEILHKVPAEYSDEARNARRSGIVVLAVTVDATGKVTNAQVIESLGLGLDEKAIEAVKKWSFRPGYQGGRPVSVTLKVELEFQIQ